MLSKKNLNLCFITRPDTIDHSFHLDPHHSSSSTVATTINSATTATASCSASSSSSSALLKTFNSMYDMTPHSTSKSLSEEDFCALDSEPEPDFSTIFASPRLFFSSPGRSNSIIESTPISTSTSITNIGIPIPKESPDPYKDFRRSMQEMVDARKLSDVTSDWDYLHELLLCYLSLNPKRNHQYIIGAFADLLLTLTAASPSPSTSTSASAADDPKTHSDSQPSSGVR